MHWQRGRAIKLPIGYGMISSRDRIIHALIRPEELCSLSLTDWDLLIRMGRSGGLLGRLHFVILERGLSSKVPVRVARHLESAWLVTKNEERIIRWEVDRLRKVLAPTGVPIILLKGAAYVFANLAVAKGRLASDVDILVPRDSLPLVEDTLLKHGWECVKPEEYDQYFYRTWAHELPPLRHRERKTVVDVHHTILPLTGRLRPNPKKLIEAAQPIDGPMLKILAPIDMILHSAAHVFQDGSLERGLRDLFDLDDLFRSFSSMPEFWPRLGSRAQELELSRPLFYALRYCHSFLATPIPDWVLRESRRWRGIWPASLVMDNLVRRALTPKDRMIDGFWTTFARRSLYIRSHWLRMPPLLLTGHLLRKSLMRK